jgi:hypothetical protein
MTVSSHGTKGKKERSGIGASGGQTSTTGNSSVNVSKNLISGQLEGGSPTKHGKGHGTLHVPLNPHLSGAGYILGITGKSS